MVSFSGASGDHRPAKSWPIFFSKLSGADQFCVCKRPVIDEWNTQVQACNVVSNCHGELQRTVTALGVPIPKNEACEKQSIIVCRVFGFIAKPVSQTMRADVTPIKPQFGTIFPWRQFLPDIQYCNDDMYRMREYNSGRE